MKARDPHAFLHDIIAGEEWSHCEAVSLERTLQAARSRRRNRRIRTSLGLITLVALSVVWLVQSLRRESMETPSMARHETIPTRETSIARSEPRLPVTSEAPVASGTEHQRVPVRVPSAVASAVGTLRTRDLPPGMKVETTTSISITRIVSSLAPETIINTNSRDELFEQIGDEELVLLAGVPAVVVHIGSRGAELVRLGSAFQ